jgi:hypothetical protein
MYFENSMTFRRKISPSSSASKSKPSKKSAEASSKLSSASVLFDLLYEHEDGGDICLRNVVLSPNYMALQSKQTAIISENVKP